MLYCDRLECRAICPNLNPISDQNVHAQIHVTWSKFILQILSLLSWHFRNHIVTFILYLWYITYIFA